ncbi:MAG TPA: AI-2E family transporter [Acidimicrobiales bacterium]|nr:AI-2E family transporter [Acidimicrobiales bacterium]
MSSEIPQRRSTDGHGARILRRADASNVPLRTILVSVFTVAGVYLAALIVYRLRVLVMLVLVGSFVALILNPGVNRLQRWGLRRGWAVSAVTFVAVVVFVGLAVAFGYPLINAITNLSHSLPAYVHRAEHGKGWIGHLLRHYHVEKWIRKNSTKLISLARGLSRPALQLGKGAVTVVLALLTVFTFVVLLLLEAPKARVWVISSISPERSARLVRLGSEVSRSATGYALGNLLTSIAAGVTVGVTLWLLGVPFAFLWALWVGLVDFLPTIGGALAGIPTVLFAFGHSLTSGIVTAIVFLAYTQLENHVLNPVVMSRTVRLNPLWVFIAVLVGAEVGAWVGGLFGGFLGVLLAIPAAATIHAVIRELRAPPPEVATPHRE